jgi:hypothetical protein
MMRPMADPKPVESKLSAEVQAVLERTYLRLRRIVTQERMRGGPVVNDVAVARKIEAAVRQKYPK